LWRKTNGAESDDSTQGVHLPDDRRSPSERSDGTITTHSLGAFKQKPGNVPNFAAACVPFIRA
jgi:hypothetical protein